MDNHLGRALARVVRDLEVTGVPAPRVEVSDWQTHEPAESALLWTAGGSGMGVWVDPSLPGPDRVAMVADQVQELVVAEMPRHHLPTNRPRCPEHPDNHPLAAVARDDAVWVCPVSGRAVAVVGALPVDNAGVDS